VALGTLVFLLIRRKSSDLRVGRSNWGLLGISVIISVAGLGLLLTSLAYLWVAVAETVRRAVGSIAALLIGRWFFHEPITTAKVVGVALMSAGVALILL
jgi:multidrug transporter EmrE-like cation transporter